ncbi:MAG: hypothetical protein AB1762_06090 [Gemmatimonadota bacterium]
MAGKKFHQIRGRVTDELYERFLETALELDVSNQDLVSRVMTWYLGQPTPFKKRIAFNLSLEEVAEMAQPIVGEPARDRQERAATAALAQDRVRSREDRESGRSKARGG